MTLVALAIILAVGGCVQSSISGADLEAVPEAALLPPGAVVLHQGSDDGRWNIDGNIPPRHFLWAGVKQSPSEIEGFYREELRSKGWSEGSRRTDDGPSQDSSDAWSWEKGDMVLQVSVKSDEFRSRADPAWASHPTLINVVLAGFSS